MLLFLSKSTTPILGWIAQLLGWIINGIYTLLDKVGIQNVALAIIIYTIIVYLLMTPIQINSQKMMKMQGLIQPELREVQKKYAGRRDSASQQKMNEETMAIYDKYGVSPTGSCLPMLLQLILMFSVYEVIYHIPGYITKVAGIFTGLADKLYNTNGALPIISNFIAANKMNLRSLATPLTRTNIVDFLYMLSPRQWLMFSEIPQFSHLSTSIAETALEGQRITTFLGMNISESTINSIKYAAQNGTVLVVIAAILIPVLAFLTQFISTKLAPGQNNTNPNDTTAASMKMMNYIMPIFTTILCFSLSVGVGIYWIAGGVIRIIQQVVINRAMMKISVEDIIAKGKKKQERKLERARAAGKTDVNINQKANTYTYVPRNSVKKYTNDGRDVDYYSNAKEASPDSITGKANLVRRLDEQKRNNKKK